MIGFLRGRLAAKAPPSLLLDVGGVGYEVEAPLSTFEALPAVGEAVFLHTHLVVREDAHVLYGFASTAERSLFRNLLRVNGVGARLGLTLLSGLSVEEFHRCVHGGDVAALVRLPGIGRKTAERLVIELRDRLPDLPPAAAVAGAAPASETASPVQEALSALVALGFKPPEAARLVAAIAVEGRCCEEIIRDALRMAAG